MNVCVNHKPLAGFFFVKTECWKKAESLNMITSFIVNPNPSMSALTSILNYYKHIKS